MKVLIIADVHGNLEALKAVWLTRITPSVPAPRGGSHYHQPRKRWSTTAWRCSRGPQGHRDGNFSFCRVASGSSAPWRLWNGAERSQPRRRYSLLRTGQPSLFLTPAGPVNGRPQAEDSGFYIPAACSGSYVESGSGVYTA